MYSFNFMPFFMLFASSDPDYPLETYYAPYKTLVGKTSAFFANFCQ